MSREAGEHKNAFRAKSKWPEIALLPSQTGMPMPGHAAPRIACNRFLKESFGHIDLL